MEVVGKKVMRFAIALNLSLSGVKMVHIRNTRSRNEYERRGRPGVLQHHSLNGRIFGGRSPTRLDAANLGCRTSLPLLTPMGHITIDQSCIGQNHETL